ncbi:MAG: restriction endonuclease subunit S, partial [Ignavibacterium sp.]|nr:restriction endonuclease subunit S [Ignavibacterium sp.]
LFYSLNSPIFQKSVINSAGGSATPIINKQRWISLVIPLPPLAEQKRIVEKVNSLMVLLDELEEKRERRNKKRIKLNNASLDKLLTSKDDKELKTNWKRIEENFSTLYSVPENVEKLKQAILQLAIQGKLTEQDPKDEPASELLKKIKKEKDKLIAEGIIKKQNELPPIKDEEKPFVLPKGWNWAYAANVTLLITDGEHVTPKRINYRDIPLATAKNIRDGFIDLRNTDFVSRETAEKSWLRCHPIYNDLLMVCVGATTGRLCLLKDATEMVLVRSVALLRPFEQTIYPEYFEIVVRNPNCQEQIWKQVKQTAQPCLYINRMEQLKIPLPPLNEQKRIVEKVNELMSLCNALEAKLTKKEETAEKLVGAVVSAVANHNKPKDEKKLRT